MTESGFIFQATDGVPLKMWTRGVPVEDKAMEQLHNIAALPFVYRHVAAMPDCHWGYGTTVGSVFATKGAIIAAAVGVDIGCGMMAVQTSPTAACLPGSLSGIHNYPDHFELRQVAEPDHLYSNTIRKLEPSRVLPWRVVT